MLSKDVWTENQSTTMILTPQQNKDKLCNRELNTTAYKVSVKIKWSNRPVKKKSYKIPM